MNDVIVFVLRLYMTVLLAGGLGLSFSTFLDVIKEKMWWVLLVVAMILFPADFLALYCLVKIWTTPIVF